ncbi:hypothetical protein [Lacticaseibacillus saniviri]|nr:hypothetical protein [Lacticaseibacillus saniviri]
MVLILDLLVALTTIYFVINLGRDVWQHREMAKKNPRMAGYYRSPRA